MKSEQELRQEIKAMRAKARKLAGLDCGKAIYGTRIAVLAWVLGDTDEKPSEK